MTKMLPLANHLVNVAKSDGFTALHIAAKGGFVLTTTALIDLVRLVVDSHRRSLGCLEERLRLVANSHMLLVERVVHGSIRPTFISTIIQPLLSHFFRACNSRSLKCCYAVPLYNSYVILGKIILKLIH